MLFSSLPTATWCPTLGRLWNCKHFGSVASYWMTYRCSRGTCISFNPQFNFCSQNYVLRYKWRGWCPSLRSNWWRRSSFECTYPSAIAISRYHFSWCHQMHFIFRRCPTARIALRLITLGLDRQFLLLGSEDGSFSVALDAEARWKILQSTLDKSPLLGLPSEYLLSP